MSSHRPPTLRLATPTSRAAAASVLAVALCSSAADAAAQQARQGEPEGSTWGLGIGVTSTQKPYQGIDRENRLVPLITFENRYVRIFGPMAEVKLPSLGLGGSQRVDFSLVARMNPDGAGYEDNDAPILNGMDERKGGFWAGAKAVWKTGVADVSAEWLGDASSNSKGQRFAVDVLNRIYAAWSAVQQVPYGALVLDRGLPDGDGLALLQRLRGAGSSIPCLVLTARDA